MSSGSCSADSTRNPPRCCFKYVRAGSPTPPAHLHPPPRTSGSPAHICTPLSGLFPGTELAEPLPGAAVPSPPGGPDRTGHSPAPGPAPRSGRRDSGPARYRPACPSGSAPSRHPGTWLCVPAGPPGAEQSGAGAGGGGSATAPPPTSASTSARGRALPLPARSGAQPGAPGHRDTGTAPGHPRAQPRLPRQPGRSSLSGLHRETVQLGEGDLSPHQRPIVRFTGHAAPHDKTAV